MKNSQFTPKLPFRLPVKNIPAALRRVESAIKREPHSSQLLTWKAILLQLDETGNGIQNLHRAKAALLKAVLINPNDMEANIEALHFFNIVVPDQKLEKEAALRIKQLCKNGEEALRLCENS